MSLGLGIDLGGTNLRVALIGPGGEILAAARGRLSDREPTAVVERAFELVDGELRASRGDEVVEAPVCIGVAGQVHPASGVIAVAPNLGWRDVAFGELMGERFGRPVRVLNDLSAIALGEAKAGAGRGAGDLVCLFVGTGVGMGALLDGQMVEGSTGMAAELGHVKIACPSEGRRCGCGDRGCLEAYTSGAHLSELLAEKAAVGVPTRLVEEVRGDLTQIDAVRIEAAVADRDPAATELWHEIAERLGRAVGTVVPLFDPEVLVLGGGVLDRAPLLRQWTHEQAYRHVGPAYAAHLRVVDSELGDDAGVIGAGLAAMVTWPGKTASRGGEI